MTWASPWLAKISHPSIEMLLKATRALLEHGGLGEWKHRASPLLGFYSHVPKTEPTKDGGRLQPKGNLVRGVFDLDGCCQTLRFNDC